MTETYNAKAMWHKDDETAPPPNYQSNKYGHDRREMVKYATGIIDLNTAICIAKAAEAQRMFDDAQKLAGWIRSATIGFASDLYRESRRARFTANYLADKALERRDYKQAMMYRQEARDARREQREIERKP